MLVFVPDAPKLSRSIHPACRNAMVKVIARAFRRRDMLESGNQGDRQRCFRLYPLPDET
jgi:hypothetical protein